MPFRRCTTLLFRDMARKLLGIVGAMIGRGSGRTKPPQLLQGRRQNRDRGFGLHLVPAFRILGRHLVRRSFGFLPGV
jgi:hypothetical protein